MADPTDFRKDLPSLNRAVSQDGSPVDPGLGPAPAGPSLGLLGRLGLWTKRLAQKAGLPSTPLVMVGQPGKKILREQNVGDEEWLAGGLWAVAVSSNVSAIRYDRERFRLYVAFTGASGGRTRLYRYDGVLEPLALEMFHCDSMGKFVHRRLEPPRQGKPYGGSHKGQRVAFD